MLAARGRTASVGPVWVCMAETRPSASGLRRPASEPRQRCGGVTATRNRNLSGVVGLGWWTVVVPRRPCSHHVPARGLMNACGGAPFRPHHMFERAAELWLVKLDGQGRRGANARTTATRTGSDWPFTSHTFRKTAAAIWHDSGLLTDRQKADLTRHAKISTLTDICVARGELHPKGAAVMDTAAGLTRECSPRTVLCVGCVDV